MNHGTPKQQREHGRAVIALVEAWRDDRWDDVNVIVGHEVRPDVDRADGILMSAIMFLWRLEPTGWLAEHRKYLLEFDQGPDE